MLFDEPTLRKLTRLTLVAQRVRAGLIKGERRSVKRGASLEFADYRDYTPGDDLRRLDWKAYARLDRPFLKLFEEEEDLAVHILLDGSQSMDWGEDETHKFRYGLRLAGAVGAIALAAGDQVTTSILRSGQVGNQLGPLHSQAHTFNLLQFLETQQPGGETGLYRSLREYTLAARRPGLAFLISDLLTSGDYQGGLSELQGRGYEAGILHVLAPDELDPILTGDLRLVDVETGHAQEVTIDGGLRDLYRQRVETWRADIAAWCRRRGIRYLPVDTAVPWERVILQEMRAAGVVG